MGFGICGKILYSSIRQRSLRQQLQSAAGRQFVILTYHRVLPAAGLTHAVEPGMYVTPETLLGHLRFLKKHFNLLSFAQLEQDADFMADAENDRPCCLLTFDDGWLDFYTHAWPILRQENVPATVFLPTRLIGSASRFWTERLAAVMSDRGFDCLLAAFTDAEQKGLSRIRSGPARLAFAIRTLKKYEHEQIDVLLAECEKKPGLSGCSERSFMDWTEIRDISRSGLVSFGSHTVNHAILTTLAKTKIRDELVNSRQKLLAEKVVSAKIPFCYPNGNYTAEIADMVRQAGYSSAVTTVSGWNLHNNDLFTLKRIGLHQDISATESLFAYRLARNLS